MRLHLQKKLFVGPKDCVDEILLAPLHSKISAASQSVLGCLFASRFTLVFDALAFTGQPVRALSPSGLSAAVTRLCDLHATFVRTQRLATFCGF
mgnify:CR=1 FL=1